MSRLFRNFNLSGILIIIFLILESACHSQTREAAVAGQFYPGSPSELKKELQNLFAAKSPYSTGWKGTGCSLHHMQDMFFQVQWQLKALSRLTGTDSLITYF